MTTPAEAAPDSAPAAGVDGPRPPPGTRARRSSADLRSRSRRGAATALGGDATTAWLRADRRRGGRVRRLPWSERLYPPTRLRGGQTRRRTPLVRTRPAPATPGEVPAGAEASCRRGTRLRLALAPACRAGVVLETWGPPRPRAAGAASDPGRRSPPTRRWPGSRARLEPGDPPPRPGRRAPGRRSHALAAAAPQRALLTRTLIRLDEGAEVGLVEELVAAGPDIACAAGEPVPQALFGGTTEIDLAKGAILRFASIQDLAGGTTAIQQRTSRIGEGATLRFAIAQLGGRVVRSRIDNRLEGDGGEVEQVEIVFGGRQQLFDLTAYTRHIGRDTTGNLLSKAVLQHGSRAYIKGLISIEKTARGTDSFLGEFGMILDKQSRSVTIPSLEIDQPDCRRAAHASSVGPIDPAQLFYLESRGITPDEARKFITLGFLEPVVARVPLEAEQERLWGILEAKWPTPSTPRRRLPDRVSRRVDCGPLEDLAEGTMQMAWVDGTEPLLVVNAGGTVRAVQGICSHEYFELDRGFLTGGTLTCALHLSRFDLSSGEALDPPADEPLAVYPVTIEAGRIIVEYPD